MLHEFLSTNRDELIARCRAKVAKRSAPRATEAELKHGIPQFLEQLIRTLRIEEKTHRSQGDSVSASSEEGRISGESEPSRAPASSEIGQTAAKHGTELLLGGFTVDQVVHDYGDLCQSITALALESNAPVSTDEFRTLNRCLDNATADAVTEYSRQRDQHMTAEGNERLGVFAHELRNLLTAATLALSAIKRGNVAIGGATGAVLERSMNGLRALVDRSLTEVRLTAGMPVRRERIPLAEFIEEIQVAGALEANASGVELTVEVADGGLAVDADRQILASAVSNLMSNAVKFTRANGRVKLRAHAVANRILIEITDECGGLSTETLDDLFRPFEQQHSDRSGLGLGLAISRRGIEAIGGELRARSTAGKGCTFTVDLPKSPLLV